MMTLRMFTSSIKIKETETNCRSIAHFYRDCEIWPRLNPSVVLAPAPNAIQATSAKSLFMGGSGKVTLTATLHRLTWIAGQQCFVKVTVINNSKKKIKSLNISLFRSTVVFKPDLNLDVDASVEPDPDACQTYTAEKQVAESTLHMATTLSRGHASAKGWWSGVHAGETLDFAHFILLPVRELCPCHEAFPVLNFITARCTFCFPK